MRTGLNILWFISGGCIAALVWFLGAGFMALTVIGLPWSRACLEIAKLNLHPFGRDVIPVDALTGQSDPLSTTVKLVANLIWLPFGLLLAIIHVMHGAAMFCTIIGIPFGLQAFKLAGISLAPVGQRVVTNEVARAAYVRTATTRLSRYRRLQ